MIRTESDSRHFASQWGLNLTLIKIKPIIPPPFFFFLNLGSVTLNIQLEETKQSKWLVKVRRHPQDCSNGKSTVTVYILEMR